MGAIDRESDVVGTREYYSNIRIWPRMPGAIDPRGWLSNFDNSDDRYIALALLDSFIYFDEAQTEEMVVSALHALSGEIEAEKAVTSRTGQSWVAFLKNLVVTFPTDRVTDPAGSGHHFIRVVRNRLQFSDEMLMEPRDLVRKTYVSTHPRNLILVDDFAGSGSQFLAGWTKPVEIYPGVYSSLEELAVSGKFKRIFYTPAICTATAVQNIQQAAPQVCVRPAHVLPDAYSAASSETILVPPEIRPLLEGFLRKYASRAGYPESELFGFERSGLAIAFHDSIPDNTLPIFYGRGSGWKPLRRRSNVAT